MGLGSVAVGLERRVAVEHGSPTAAVPRARTAHFDPSPRAIPAVPVHWSPGRRLQRACVDVQDLAGARDPGFEAFDIGWCPGLAPQAIGFLVEVAARQRHALAGLQVIVRQAADSLDLPDRWSRLAGVALASARP